MNAEGQVYFGPEEDIPAEDKARLTAAEVEAAYVAEQLLREKAAFLEELQRERTRDE